MNSEGNIGRALISARPKSRSRACAAAFRVCAGLFTAATLSLFSVPAHSVPSYAVQTGQPCAACHVGAFGPQLKPYGRDFKLFGYTGGYTGKGAPNNFPPLAATVQTSLTHTSADEPGNAPHFAANDNLALDQISVYYAGRITGHFGAFAQFTYDGAARDFHWDNVDVRWAKDATLFGEDFAFGFSGNNSPTVTDLWNSTPAWGFPYNASSIADTPVAATLIDGALGQAVIGAGAYAMWNEWVYAEFDGYKGLGRDVRNAFGVTPVAGSDSVDGLAPYWRLAVTHDFDKGRQNFEIGTYGIEARLLPEGVKGVGTDNYLDTALDANYQLIWNPKDVTSNIVSAHATLIHEKLDLGASQAAFGTHAHDRLNSWRADVSYSYDATLTPSVQHFDIAGNADAVQWGGSPNSAGWLMEIAYVPWGKPDSPLSWANARFAAQYIAYDKFNGVSTAASSHDTLYLSVWLAVSLNP